MYMNNIMVMLLKNILFNFIMKILKINKIKKKEIK